MVSTDEARERAMIEATRSSSCSFNCQLVIACSTRSRSQLSSAIFREGMKARISTMTASARYCTGLAMTTNRSAWLRDARSWLLRSQYHIARWHLSSGRAIHAHHTIPVMRCRCDGACCRSSRRQRSFRLASERPRAMPPPARRRQRRRRRGRPACGSVRRRRRGWASPGARLLRLASGTLG